MTTSQGRRLFPWPRLVVTVHLANGNAVKTDGHLATRADQRLWRTPAGRAIDFRPRDELDGWELAMKSRITRLRARIRADSAALDMGSTVVAVEEMVVPPHVRG